MKKISIFLISVITLFSLTSCNKIIFINSRGFVKVKVDVLSKIPDSFDIKVGTVISDPNDHRGKTIKNTHLVNENNKDYIKEKVNYFFKKAKFYICDGFEGRNPNVGKRIEYIGENEEEYLAIVNYKENEKQTEELVLEKENNKEIKGYFAILCSTFKIYEGTIANRGENPKCWIFMQFDSYESYSTYYDIIENN